MIKQQSHLLVKRISLTGWYIVMFDCQLAERALRLDDERHL
ncbi:hypothetical protein [Sulfitobacter sp. MF3-043]